MSTIHLSDVTGGYNMENGKELMVKKMTIFRIEKRHEIRESEDFSTVIIDREGME